MNPISQQELFLFRISLEKVLRHIKLDGCKLELQQISDTLIERDELFQRIFASNPQRLNQKIIKTLKFLKQFHKLKNPKESILAITATHTTHAPLSDYDFPLFKNLLIQCVKQILSEDFSNGFEEAWNRVLDDIIEQMIASSRHTTAATSISPEFISEIGGRSIIERIHQRMYDRLYQDSWIGQFFHTKNQSTLVRKQTDFVLASAGIGERSILQSPYAMHMHMFITDEMFSIRQRYLKLAMLEEGLNSNAIQTWLDYDSSFRSAIVKRQQGECVTQCPGQMPIIPKKPAHYVPLD